MHGSRRKAGLLMRVMIFEPQYVGHNLAYVRHIAARLVEMGCEVHLLTSHQAARSEEFSKHLADVIDSIHVSAPDTYVARETSRGIRVNGPVAIWAMMQSLHRGLQSIRPEHLFVPFGNPIAHWAGMPNPVNRSLRKQHCESELVLLTGKYAYPQRDVRSKLKERFALQLLSLGPWTRVHHIVPHAWNVMRRHPSRLSTIANLLPDPIDTPPEMSRAEARALLGLAPDARWMSLVGLIEKRKGIYELLAAIESAQDRLESTDRLLLAGKATEETRALLKNRYRHLVDSGRVQCIDRHLSAQELWAACIAADVMTTPYPQHQTSASIVIRAAAVGVPVLANRIGWMAEVVDRFQLGTACDITHAPTFANAIVNAYHTSEYHRPQASARRFVAFHTIENFASRITERVAQRMGLTPSHGLSWSEVAPWEDLSLDATPTALRPSSRTTRMPLPNLHPPYGSSPVR